MIDKNSAAIAEIVENLFAAMPIIHRKLINSLDENLGISHHHFAVLGMLSRSGDLAVSEIAKRLWISKPQMTAVIDKLVTLKLVARKPDEGDRRVIYITLNPAGQKVLDHGRLTMQSVISQKLVDLEPEDLETLAVALKNINKIGAMIG
jgi:DNA-binding MarR family transcriptional regulator